MNKSPQSLQDLALIQVIKKMLRDASDLSFRLGVDIYLYNFPGFHEIKKNSYVNIINKKVEFLVTKDKRIAARGIECISTILTKSLAKRLFNHFLPHSFGFTMHEDETGIFYYEECTLPYHFVQECMTTLEDPIKWSSRALLKGRYFCLWDD
jgi:hypothetical protein